MHNYIKELKKRLETECDEHRRHLIQATLCEVELLHQQRIEATKSMTFVKKENDDNMSKTTITTQYAAFAKRKDGGEWRKLNGLFYCKGKLDAQLLIDNHKNSFEGQKWPCEYKIMSREVMTIAEEWSDVL